MSNINLILEEIHSISRPDRVEGYTKFFRASSGDICFGDKFLAIRVPEIRLLVRKHFKELELSQVEVFLKSEYNDIRFFGQQVIYKKYKFAKSFEERENLVRFLLQNIDSINHWNLVDAICGLFASYCSELGSFELLYDLAEVNTVWKRRIAIVAGITLLRTKDKKFIPIVLDIIQKNIDFEHEYIHKAIGWVLREVGKLDENALIDYLKQNWSDLKPVTRSYAIEKLRLTLDIRSFLK
jgi:3-methyladenine DNA glycosylase AlkD